MDHDGELTRYLSDLPTPVSHTFAKRLLGDVLRLLQDNVVGLEKSECILRIVGAVVSADALSWPRTATASFEQLRELLTKCTVSRPPVSDGTLTPSEAVTIVDFMLARYYRHFRLFKFCLCAAPTLALTQTAVAGVELPVAGAPLAEAIMM